MAQTFETLYQAHRHDADWLWQTLDVRSMVLDTVRQLPQTEVLALFAQFSATMPVAELAQYCYMSREEAS